MALNRIGFGMRRTSIWTPVKVSASKSIEAKEPGTYRRQKGSFSFDIASGEGMMDVEVNFEWLRNDQWRSSILGITIFSTFFSLCASAMLARHSRRAMPKISRWVRMNSGSNNKFVYYHFIRDLTNKQTCARPPGVSISNADRTASDRVYVDLSFLGVAILDAKQSREQSINTTNGTSIVRIVIYLVAYMFESKMNLKQNPIGISYVSFE